MPSTLGIVASGVWTPLELSPALWLDASDTSTITESGGSVSQWDDKSGNGHHVVQATPANQPTTGAATINNLNVILLDGSDWIKNTTAPSLTQPNTTFIVLKFGALDVSFQYVLDGHSRPQNLLSTISTTSLRIGSQPFPTIASGLDTSTTYVCDWVMNGASSEAKLNGVSSGTVDAGTGGGSGITVGAADNTGFPMRPNGLVAEILFFNGLMSDTNRATVRSYLASKWDIAI